MKATVTNVNIRGCEPKMNKKDEPYLLVRLEDETGKAYELVDKVMERQSMYKRNAEGTLTIDVDTGRYTSVRIADFVPNKK